MKENRLDWSENYRVNSGPGEVDMINMNEKMKKAITVANNEDLDTKTIAFLEEIVSKTKIINDCVIYDDEGIEESDIDWDRIGKFFGDLTGYEVSSNEIRLWKDEFRTQQYQKIASSLHNMLKNKYRNRRFAVYVCVYEDSIDIRFHTYRITEGFWLLEDLNGYEDPIICLWDNEEPE